MLLNVVSKTNVSKVIDQQISQSADHWMLLVSFSAGMECLAKPEMVLLFMRVHCVKYNSSPKILCKACFNVLKKIWETCPYFCFILCLFFFPFICLQVSVRFINILQLMFWSYILNTGPSLILIYTGFSHSSFSFHSSLPVRICIYRHTVHMQENSTELKTPRGSSRPDSFRELPMAFGTRDTLWVHCGAGWGQVIAVNQFGTRLGAKMGILCGDSIA